MRTYVVKRLIQLIPVLLGITFLSFAMMRIAGSDAITELYGDKGAVAQEIVDAKRAELGLDRPFLTQYVSWLGGLLTGDMGKSYVSGRDVFQTFVSKLPATLLLTALSILLTVIISIPLGVLAAVNHDRLIDYALRVLSFIGNSLPNFFVALLLMQLLAIRWKLLPVLSSGTGLKSAVMPTLTLAIAMSAKYMRQVRATVLEELNKMSVLNSYSDYTDTQNEKKIVGKDKKGGYKTESLEKSKQVNFQPVGENGYWDFSKSGKENAEEYLRMCSEDGRLPKFSQFLVDNGDGSFSLPKGTDKRSTTIREGYWKTLIDFKMYENDSYGRTKEDGTKTKVKGSFQGNKSSDCVSKSI